MLKTCLTAALAAVSLCAGALTPASAAFVTQPGEQVGLAPGLPLPEGFYVLDTFSWGRADYRNAPDIGVNIPILIYSSPFKIFGARIEPVIAFPSVFVSPRNPAPIPNRDLSVFYNPFVGSIFAWDLGGGLGVSYISGAYIAVGDRGSLGLGFAGTPLVTQSASSTISQRFAASWVGDGSYNLSAVLTYSLTVDPHARFGGTVGAVLGSIPQSDSLNLDLTATKKFGKFEIGAVAFGYTDLPVNRRDPLYATYQKGGFFAVGGLIGYDFGRFTLQSFVTRQIAARDTFSAAGVRQRNEETRGWFRVVLPFPFTPPAPAPTPIVRKY